MFGKTVWVDLSSGTVRVGEQKPEFHRRFLGGSGVAIYYLLQGLRRGTDALSPDNILVFAPGLLAGSGGPAVPRYVVCARSPLTGALAKSESGGYWGPELKRAGVGAIVVTGRAQKPSYLYVTSDAVEIRSAQGMWGLNTGETEDAIRQETGDRRVRVASIGKGGENCVRFAAIASDITHFNGRNGLGAVMGAKNLKAVAVRGEQLLDVYDADRVKEISRAAARLSRVHPLSRMLHEKGTPAGVEAVAAGGSLPTNNWQSTAFEAAGQIGGDILNSKYLIKRGGCHSCPVQCKRVVAVRGESINVDPRYGGPEYETLLAFGSNCGVGDFEIIAKANELCNKYTLDTISTGMTISFAMACFENGLITREETGGLDLSFGNEEAVLTLISQIAHRRGFGDLLAEGSVRAARRIGKGAETFLLAVKGQELPMHDPRVKTGLGLQFALSPNGADHWFAQHDPLFATEESPGVAALEPLGLHGPVGPLDLGPAKVRLIRETSLLNSMYDCLGVCIFGAVARSMMSLGSLVELVSAATGWDTNLRELIQAGERALVMARLFNAREGFRRADDVLPSRFFTPFADGPLRGSNAIDPDAFSDAVDLYYSMSGWESESGVPVRGKLVELSLDEFADCPATIAAGS